MLRPMMPLDDSHLSRLSATEKPDFPSPVSSSEFSSKITSSKPATTTVLPDSPAPSTHTFDNRDPENRSVLESDRASISTADPVTPKLNTFPLTPPETPERASTRPKPNTQIPSSALSTLSEQSEHQLPRSPAQEHSVRRTDSSEELLVSEEPLVSEELLVFEEPLVSEEPASELIASPSTSDLSISDIEQSDSEESRPPSPRRGTIRYYIRLLLDTLAPSRKRRAKARKPDSKGLPPDVKSVIRLMREVGEGKHMSTQLSSRRKLSPSGYQILLDRLEKDQVLSDYVDNELGGYRFYYSHTEKQFTVYMKTALHDTFAICVHDIIRDFLKECERSEHEIIKNIAQRIQSIGSSGVGSCDLGDPEPDMSYQFQERESPGLIIEVAWGNGISLEEKAKGYFEMAGGETRTVIGFDLNAIYGKQAAAESKWKVLRTNWKLGKSPFCPEDVVLLDPEADKMTANFSVWRLDEKNVLQKVFRTASNQHIPGADLKLSLQDFVSEEAVTTLCKKEVLQEIEYPIFEISSEALCECLRKAVIQYRPRWRLRLQAALQKKIKKKKEEIAAASNQRHASLLEEAPKASTREGSIWLDGRRLSDRIRRLAK